MNTTASRRWIFIIIALLLFLAACSTQTNVPTANPASNEPPAASAPEGSTGGGLLPRRLMVVGKSMEPTIKEGQTLSYKTVKYADLQRGDILVFQKEEAMAIRRLIGLPGETLEIRDSVVYINDQALNETYLTLPAGENLEKRTLANDEYFLICDNPEAREDSRAYGPVKAADLMGRVNLP